MFTGEISLTLSPFNPGAEEEDKDKTTLDVETEKLYTKTKKMICEIIVDSYKDSLSELNLLELLTGMSWIFVCMSSQYIMITLAILQALK